MQHPVAMTCLLLVTAGACGRSMQLAERPLLAPASGSRVSFDLPLLGGGHLRANDRLGRYVVLKPFAAWCHPCWDELPPLLELALRHHQQTQIAFVGVSFDQKPDSAQDFVSRLGISFPVVLDPTAQLARQLQLRTLSELFLINQKGQLLAHYRRCDKAALADLDRRLDAVVLAKGAPQ